MSKIDVLQSVISPVLLKRAADLSRHLKLLNIPHALIGGLAVGLHGYPRTTKDVDFLVGNQAFASTTPFLIYKDELKDLVRIGETDLMSVPDKYPSLASELRLEDDIPLISLRGLILMKLDAFRTRDQDDIRNLLSKFPYEIRSLRDYLAEEAPLLINRLAEILSPRR